MEWKDALTRVENTLTKCSPSPTDVYKTAIHEAVHKGSTKLASCAFKMYFNKSVLGTIQPLQSGGFNLCTKYWLTREMPAGPEPLRTSIITNRRPSPGNGGAA